ncbi:MAG: hypothetical protein IJS15_11855 [Victivallales bacterium]|nr:hypothetical protein [Victivallales bacterium]
MTTAIPSLDEFRPVPFYFITTQDPEDFAGDKIPAAMRRVKEAGYGGILFFNKPPKGFDEETYLSDYYFDILERFIIAAKNESLAVWINDGFNFPPGDAAGRIKKANPTLVPMRIRPNAEGRLDIVEVSWGFPAFEEPESSRLFIQFVYEEHYKHLGKYFGDGISGFFSDADNRRANFWAKKQLNGENFYPWCKRFPEIFHSRYGYSIETRLKGLFDGTDKQVCVDYWSLTSELYQQWFCNNYNWCRDHGIGYSFHTSDTGPLNLEKCFRSSMFSEGCTLDILKYSFMPGTDHELFALDGGRHYDDRLFSPAVTRAGGIERLGTPDFSDTLHDIRAKYAGSAAFLYGRQRALCEMFAATNWGVTFDGLRRIAAWQIMQGINFIVPHAVHYKFFSGTKFFAPPEFIHGPYGKTVREFNDWLATCCRAAASGEYLADIGVIDPAEYAWKHIDTENFFKVCDRLNRLPQGYVICRKEDASRFKVVIDPVADENIPELPETDVSFDGGEVAFMRRRLEDGTNYILVSNIWSDDVLTGTLRFGGNNYSLELYPGEIAIVGGPFESYRSPAVTTLKHRFAETVPVKWAAENVIPFDEKLVFEAEGNLALYLEVPAALAGKASLNGTRLEGGVPVQVEDDDYVRYTLPSVQKGEIVLEEASEFQTPCRLVGEFDVVSVREGDWDHAVFHDYLLNMYAPKSEVVKLSPRRQTLATNRGWATQGQIFYSNTVEYDLGDVDVADGDILSLPKVAGSAELLIDGVSAGKLALAPYDFKLNVTGKHRLAVRCFGTYANQLERYAAPSGLLATPELRA